MRCFVVRVPKKYLISAVSIATAIALFFTVTSLASGSQPVYKIGGFDAPKVAYLTFDDGPSNTTAEVLDVLKEKGVKATFFVIGTALTEQPELYKRIVDEGHNLGIHSNTHEYKEIYQSSETFWDDLNRLRQSVETITGTTVTCYRFPGGSSNSMFKRYSKQGDMVETLINELGEEGLAFFDWTVSGEDAVGGRKSASNIASRVVKESLKQPNPVILLHDSKSQRTTAEALPTIIDELTAEGYSFDVLTPGITCHHSR